MSEKKGFLKTLFGTTSTIEIARKIIAVIIIIAFSIPGVSTLLAQQMTKIVQTEIAPIKNYIFGEIAKLITKNFDKIQSDPGDVKLIDIEYCLENWEFMQNISKENLTVLEKKITVLEKFYLEKVGKT